MLPLPRTWSATGRRSRSGLPASLVFILGLAWASPALATCPPDPLAERDRAVFVFRNLGLFTDDALSWGQRNLHALFHLWLPQLSRTPLLRTLMPRTPAPDPYAERNRARITLQALTTLADDALMRGMNTMAATTPLLKNYLLRILWELHFLYIDSSLQQLQDVRKPERSKLLGNLVNWLAKQKERSHSPSLFSACSSQATQGLSRVIASNIVCLATYEKSLVHCRLLERLAEKLFRECRQEVARFGFLFAGSCDDATVAAIASEYGASNQLARKFCLAVNNNAPDSCPGRQVVGEGPRLLCQALATGDVTPCGKISDPETSSDCRQELSALRVIHGQATLEQFLSGDLSNRPLMVPALLARKSPASCPEYSRRLLKQARQQFRNCLASAPSISIDDR